MEAFWITALILSFLYLLGEIITAFHSRIKYSNPGVYCQKQERLRELDEAVTRIESDNNEAMEIIKAMNFDADIDDGLADRLARYRDDEIALFSLKKEQRELRKYLKAAGRYVQL